MMARTCQPERLIIGCRKTSVFGIGDQIDLWKVMGYHFDTVVIRGIVDNPDLGFKCAQSTVDAI